MIQIEGSVHEAETGLPVVGVFVHVGGAGCESGGPALMAGTDSYGRYRLGVERRLLARRSDREGELLLEVLAPMPGHVVLHRELVRRGLLGRSLRVDMRVARAALGSHAVPLADGLVSLPVAVVVARTKPAQAPEVAKGLHDGVKGLVALYDRQAIPGGVGLLGGFPVPPKPPGVGPGCIYGFCPPPPIHPPTEQQMQVFKQMGLAALG